MTNVINITINVTSVWRTVLNVFSYQTITDISDEIIDYASASRSTSNILCWANRKRLLLRFLFKVRNSQGQECVKRPQSFLDKLRAIVHCFIFLYLLMKAIAAQNCTTWLSGLILKTTDKKSSKFGMCSLYSGTFAFCC